MNRKVNSHQVTYWIWPSFFVVIFLGLLLEKGCGLGRHHFSDGILVSDGDSIVPVSGNEIMPVLYGAFPELTDSDKEEKIEKFVDVMLPSILMAQQKLKLKQDSIKAVDERLNKGTATTEDSIYQKQILESYHVINLNDAIKNLEPHPISITLAQAAIESGWGTSRFCKEANNVFGMWSFDAAEERVEASVTRSGKRIYLRRYHSIYESVYDYLNTIAKVGAYKKFRKARLITKDSYRLIWYLNNYSEKGYEYVRMLRNVMEHNQLTQYDNCKLVSIKTRR